MIFKCVYLFIIIILLFAIFPSSVSWWSVTGVWMTVSPPPQDFQDSSQCSGRSQQKYRLNDLVSSSDHQFLQSFFQDFGNRSKRTNYNLYCLHPNISQPFFLVPWRGPRICQSLFFNFHSVARRNIKTHKTINLKKKKLTLDLVFWPRMSHPFVSQKHHGWNLRIWVRTQVVLLHSLSD